jgi:acyl transferase domain-containing protein
MWSAGIPIESLAGSNTSVFTGLFGKDYYDGLMKDPESLPPSLMTTNGTAMYSNRISHFYDFRGASMTLDTGCSGSLVALHHACRTIQLGESDLAIAGGSGIMLSPDMFIALSNMGVLGEDGRCYSWDHRSGGYGRGEGVATLVLKSLDAALRDGDFVHAVIRESALNQDGRTSTITSPSMEAQKKLIEECYRRAGLDISQTGYVEAHMTGTSTGDPIEAEAIARTFGKNRAEDDAVFVGSVKTNVGHAEGVSGLAALIKTVFALQKRLIPPNMNYEKPNPRIPLAEWKVQVPQSPIPWPENKALRASINNFGYGGANVHLIVEGIPKTSQSNTNGDQRDLSRSLIYILSSKDAEVTKTMAKKLGSYLHEAILPGAREELLLPADLAYTLAERRSRLPWAIAVRSSSLDDLAKKLDEENARPTRAAQSPQRVGIVFNGQGAQWHAMGRELINAYPVFCSAVQRATKVLKDYGAYWSLEGV